MAAQVPFPAFPRKVCDVILKYCAEGHEPVLFLGEHPLEKGPLPKHHAGHKLFFKVINPEENPDDDLNRLSIKRKSSGLVGASHQLRAEFLNVLASNNVLHMNPKEHSLRSTEFPDLASFLPAGYASLVKIIKIENWHHGDITQLAACFPALEKLDLQTHGNTSEYNGTLNQIARVTRESWPDDLLIGVAETKWLKIMSRVPNRQFRIDLKVTFGHWKVYFRRFFEDGFALDVWVREQADGSVSTVLKAREQWESLVEDLSTRRGRARIKWMMPADPNKADSPVRRHANRHVPNRRKPSPPPKWEDWMGEIPDDPEAEFLDNQMLTARAVMKQG